MDFSLRTHGSLKRYYLSPLAAKAFHPPPEGGWWPRTSGHEMVACERGRPLDTPGLELNSSLSKKEQSHTEARQGLGSATGRNVVTPISQMRKARLKKIKESAEPGFEPSSAFCWAPGAAPSPRLVTSTRHVLVPCPLPPLSHSARLGGLPGGGQARGRRQEAHPARREGTGRSAPAPLALPLSMVKAAG